MPKEQKTGEENKDSGQQRGNKFGDRRRRPGRNPKDRNGDEPRDEFEQRILDLARVTRVVAGGKKMNFRACVVIGNKKGKVAVALGKGADVTLAVNKAVNQAKKHLINVPLINDTIPHDVYMKDGAAKMLLKPAKKGKGVIAGGVVRIILDLAGVKNIISKILGTNNKVSNAHCTIAALSSLKPTEERKSFEVKREGETKKEEPKASSEHKTEQKVLKPKAKKSE
ncbi:MAG: 30S ribosomal protein S5 [Planctomycetes bacterium]|jgi:small subunit ribosomal protein S5|nr:30S ribosomal protein S5 [Planctomycetota bacterium]